MGRTALVLGAGIGGIVAAQTLRRLLPSGDRVVIVDRAATHHFQPSLLWLMVGERSTEDMTRPLARIVSKGIERVQGTVSRIDPQRRQVEVGGQILCADALILALGVDFAPDSVPGLSDAGLCLYSPEGAAAIHERLEHFSGGRIVVLTAAPQYKCPAAPYEAALLIDAFCRRRGIRGGTEIDVYAAEPAPMLVAGPAVGAAVRAMLEQRGISYHPEHQVQAVDASMNSLSFVNGAAAGFDLLLYVPPHRAPAVVREAGLVNESGWIPVDRHTLQTRYEGIFAIGDIVTIPLKMGRPLPKAGVFAHGQAEVVAHNLAHAWTGRGRPRRFEGEGACFIEAGNHRAGMGSGNFYAEPLPEVKLRAPSVMWHAGKVLYEKFWLYRRF